MSSLIVWDCLTVACLCDTEAFDSSDEISTCVGVGNHNLTRTGRYSVLGAVGIEPSNSSHFVFLNSLKSGADGNFVVVPRTTKYGTKLIGTFVRGKSTVDFHTRGTAVPS